jgi:hypothetical protein
MFAVKRYQRGSTLIALQRHLRRTAHAQDYFTATILMLVAFDGFTLSSTTDENDDRALRNKLTQ